MQTLPDVTAAEGSLAELAALVGGSPPAWARAGSVDLDVWLRTATTQGVLPLIAERAATSPHLPADAASWFQRQLVSHAAADLVREVELRSVLAALARHDVQPLLLKGADLAYSIYPRPDLRPRLDTDLLIAAAHRPTADVALRSIGYEAVPQVPGDLVMYQLTYVKRRGATIVHAVDLHWRIANPQRFGTVLSYEELWAARAARPALGPDAYGLAPPHALLLACVHRVVHHGNALRLIWLYDIHALSRHLPLEEVDRFVALASQRGVASMCRVSLGLAEQFFGRRLPADTLARLLLADDADPATADYLTTRRRHVRDIAWDLRSLRSWRDRARLLYQHIVPGREHANCVHARESRAAGRALCATDRARHPLVAQALVTVSLVMTSNR